MKTDPFVPGQVLGGFRVLQLLHEGASQKSTRYLVERTCCGEVIEQTHHQISMREAVGNRRCRPCRRAGVDVTAAASDPRGVHMKTGPMRGWWPSLTAMGIRGV